MTPESSGLPVALADEDGLSELLVYLPTAGARPGPSRGVRRDARYSAMQPIRRLPLGYFPAVLVAPQTGSPDRWAGSLSHQPVAVVDLGQDTVLRTGQAAMAARTPTSLMVASARWPPTSATSSFSSVSWGRGAPGAVGVDSQPPTTVTSQGRGGRC